MVIDSFNQHSAWQVFFVGLIQRCSHGDSRGVSRARGMVSKAEGDPRFVAARLVQLGSAL